MKIKYFLRSMAYWFTIKPKMILLQKLLPEAKIHPTGSRYVCAPPVMNTDIDFLVYTEKVVDMELREAGYVKTSFSHHGTSGGKPGDPFTGWRRGKVNLVVSSSLQYAETFHTATYIGRLYNLRDKSDRVIIHECLRGNKNMKNLTVHSSAYFDSDGTKKVGFQRLLDGFSGQYANAFHKAYRAKHGLKL